MGNRPKNISTAAEAAPTSPKPATPANPSDDALRTDLTKLAVPMYYDATPGAYPVTAVPMSLLLDVLAAHPAPETDGHVCTPHCKTGQGHYPAPVSDTRRVEEDVALALLDETSPGPDRQVPEWVQALPPAKRASIVRVADAVLAATPPVASDTRREVVARVIEAHVAEFEASIAWLEASIQDPVNTIGGREYDTVKLHGQRGAVYALRRLAEALAAPPAPPVVDGGWTVADWEEWAGEVAATLPEDCDGDEAQVEIIAKFVRRAAAPPVVDEADEADEVECGRCEQVRPISWTDDDEVTYCEECVNAIMTDLHADIARAPVVDEVAIRERIAQEIEDLPSRSVTGAPHYAAYIREHAARIARGATR
ncbi:hypothetical protein [Oerskovia turbata]